jgi:hypothetical protein
LENSWEIVATLLRLRAILRSPKSRPLSLSPHLAVSVIDRDAMRVTDTMPA